MASNGVETLLFGGANSAGFFRNLYRFDIATNEWIDITPPGANPNPRGAAHFAWDGASFILNGGLTDAFDSQTDTWRLVPDGAGGYAWELVCLDCPPGSRALAAFARCGDDLVLIGGERIELPTPVLTLSDIWRWSDGAWRPVAPGVPPTTDADDPAVPYAPLLASVSHGVLLVANRFARAANALATRSAFVACSARDGLRWWRERLPPAD